MHKHNRTCAGRNCNLYAVVVYFQRCNIGFYEYGCKVVFGYCQYGGNVSVGRYNYFVAIVELSKLFVGT